MTEGKCCCGLSYAAKRSGDAVGYCALSIRCGTRDEALYCDGRRDRGGFHSGTAHFVEHAIFKGTARHTASAINSYLDKLGGELNAYTTKEEIVLHATVLREDLRKAADLLFELVTCPTFPPTEIETERGVIIDEINSYKDAPAEEIYDMFEEMLFAGHPLSGPILGKTRSVKMITPEELARFVREKFVPENMVFTVVADIDEGEMASRIERLAAKFFPAHPAAPAPSSSSAPSFARLSASVQTRSSEGGTPQSTPSQSPAPQSPSSQPVSSQSLSLQSFQPWKTPLPAVEPFNLNVNRRNHQVNCIVGGYAPSLYDYPDRIAMVLLTNILGGPASNSILNSILREKRGWVYGVECTYTQYADTGIAAISLGCEKENLDKCLKAIDRELAKLRDNPISPRRLSAAKKQILGQIAVSGDNGENQCLSMGKSLLSYGHVVSDEESRTQIEAVTADDLMRLANKFFSKEVLSTLVFS